MLLCVHLYWWQGWSHLNSLKFVKNSLVFCGFNFCSIWKQIGKALAKMNWRDFDYICARNVAQVDFDCEMSSIESWETDNSMRYALRLSNRQICIFHWCQYMLHSFTCHSSRLLEAINVPSFVESTPPPSPPSPSQHRQNVHANTKSIE